MKKIVDITKAQGGQREKEHFALLWRMFVKHDVYIIILLHNGLK